MTFNSILVLLRSGNYLKIRRKLWPKGRYLALGIILIDGGKTKLMDTKKLEELDAFNANDWEKSTT